MGDCDVNWVIVVLWVICLYCFVFGFVDTFVLYSLICESKIFYLLMWRKFQQNSANRKRATLACGFSFECIAHVL